MSVLTGEIMSVLTLFDFRFCMILLLMLILKPIRPFLFNRFTLFDFAIGGLLLWVFFYNGALDLFFFLSHHDLYIRVSDGFCLERTEFS